MLIHAQVRRRQNAARGRSRSPRPRRFCRSMIEDLSTSYENLAALFRFAEKLATAPSFRGISARWPCAIAGARRRSEAHLWHRGRAPESLDLVYRPTDSTIRRKQTSLATDDRFRGMPRVPHGPAEHRGRLRGASRPQDPLQPRARQRVRVPGAFSGRRARRVDGVSQGDAPNYFNAAQTKIVRVVAEFIGIARTTATLQEQRQEQQRATRELEIAAEIQQCSCRAAFPDSAEGAHLRRLAGRRARWAAITLT